MYNKQIDPDLLQAIVAVRQPAARPGPGLKTGFAPADRSTARDQRRLFL